MTLHFNFLLDLAANRQWSQAFHTMVFPYPEIMVLPNDTFLVGCSIKNHSFWCIRILGNTPCIVYIINFDFQKVTHQLTFQSGHSHL